MNAIKLIVSAVAIFYSNEEKVLKDNFVERKLYTKTEIIHNDLIGCNENYIEFNKQLLMSRYKLNYDQVDFECQSVIDHKGVIHTKKKYKIIY